VEAIRANKVAAQYQMDRLLRVGPRPRATGLAKNLKTKKKDLVVIAA